jgi:hypothetical protein
MRAPQNVSESVRRLNPEIYGSPCAFVATVSPEPPKPRAKKRIRQSSKTMNKLESEFYGRLKRLWEVVHYEPMRIKLCNGVVYIPDFMVVGPTGTVVFYETKGNQPIQDDSSVKIKMAAQQYPRFKFVLVWKENGKWNEQVILP